MQWLSGNLLEQAIDLIGKVPSPVIQSAEAAAKVFEATHLGTPLGEAAGRLGDVLEAWDSQKQISEFEKAVAEAEVRQAEISSETDNFLKGIADAADVETRLPTVEDIAQHLQLSDAARALDTAEASPGFQEWLRQADAWKNAESRTADLGVDAADDIDETWLPEEGEGLDYAGDADEDTDDDTDDDYSELLDEDDVDFDDG